MEPGPWSQLRELEILGRNMSSNFRASQSCSVSSEPWIYVPGISSGSQQEPRGTPRSISIGCSGPPLTHHTPNQTVVHPSAPAWCSMVLPAQGMVPSLAHICHP